jgi:tape measure domain-containing protein
MLYGRKEDDIMLKLDIQKFSDGKIVIDTELNSKNFENGLNKIQNTAKGAGTSIKNIVAGLGITKLIGAAMSQVNSSIDGAVKRIDTFNAYPKVLKNFGVSADEAKKSISRIDKSVRGLPTSLDQAVGGVQNLFMVTKDLGQAEKLFKAINDSAMVFAGGSTEAVDRFSYAFKQAMSSGKVSAQDFNQMNEAIPGLMDKVAESMGINYSTLKEGLSDGSISMDQFNDALKKLDTEGGAGMSALEKVAKNSTGGIETSVTNMKTSITRGVADMIKEIDKGLKDFGGLSGVISSLGKLAETALKEIGKYLPSIVKFAIEAGKVIVKIAPFIAPLVAGFVAMGAALKVMEIVKTITTAFAAFNAILLANPIVLIIGLIAGLVAAFIILWKKSDAFRNFWINLWDGIKKLFEDWVNGFKLMVESLKSVFSSVINWFNAKIQYWINIFRGVINFITGVFTGNWKQAFNGLKQVASAFINSFLNSFGGLPRRMLSVGINVVRGIWSGISGSLSWIKNKISGWVGNVLNFIKKLFGIHSPSTVMRDEVGKYLAQGMGVGFDNELDNVYKDMQKAIDIENGKMQANVQTGKVFNTLASTTPVSIDLNANVEMDKTKVGRIITPVVSETLKTGGLR